MAVQIFRGYRLVAIVAVTAIDFRVSSHEQHAKTGFRVIRSSDKIAGADYLRLWLIPRVATVVTRIEVGLQLARVILTPSEKDVSDKPSDNEYFGTSRNSRFLIAHNLKAELSASDREI